MFGYRRGGAVADGEQAEAQSEDAALSPLIWKGVRCDAC